ncbi:MAG: hypothetical protein QXR20_00480 [Candidatus Caldarchaeum sp.]
MRCRQIGFGEFLDVVFLQASTTLSTSTSMPPKTLGYTCQKTLNLSLHHPHCPASGSEESLLH